MEGHFRDLLQHLIQLLLTLGLFLQKHTNTAGKRESKIRTSLTVSWNIADIYLSSFLPGLHSFLSLFHYKNRHLSITFCTPTATSITPHPHPPPPRLLFWLLVAWPVIRGYRKWALPRILSISFGWIVLQMSACCTRVLALNILIWHIHSVSALCWRWVLDKHEQFLNLSFMLQPAPGFWIPWSLPCTSTPVTCCLCCWPLML